MCIKIASQINTILKATFISISTIVGIAHIYNTGLAADGVYNEMYIHIHLYSPYNGNKKT